MTTAARRRSVAGAVLAAGAGRRMGRPKGALVLDGERLVDRGARILTEAGCDTVYAVVQSGVTPVTGTALVNPDPSRGLRSSLELAVAAAERHDALVVQLVDLPGVTADGVRRVIAAWRPGRVVVARYADSAGPGHPMVMSPDRWRAAVALAGPDEGARAYLRARPDLVDTVEVGGSGADVDLPADLLPWRIDLPTPG